MKWKSLFAAALTAAVAWPALAQSSTGGGTPSLSFSFANNRNGGKLSVIGGAVQAETALGVEPVPANKWIELYDSDAGSDAESGAINNTETISANDARAYNFTLESDVKVTYSAKNAWSVKAVADQASSNIQPFLQSYLDDGDNPAVDGNTVGAKFTVTGIPFESYDVIIYFATDKQFAVGSGNGFLPVTVNGTVYSWTQWQSETDSGYLVSDADSTAVFGSAPENAAILGKNAIRIPALSGDLSVVGAVGDGQTSKRCSIAAFQIVEAKPSININFAQTAAEPYDVPASDAYGLEQEPGAAWQNIYGSSGTDVPLSLEAYGLYTDAKLTFSAPGTWRFPNGTQVKDPILRGFLGVPTNASNGSTVTVTDIPFTQYDVIVYFATNEENAVFQPVTINDKSYTWSTESNTTVEGDTTFGVSRGTVSEYGRNALRITCLTGDLSLKTGAQTVKTETEPFKTGNLCGIQIVCTGEVTDAAVPLERNPTISVNIADVRTPNAQGGTLSNPDADVSTTGVYGLAPVPGNAWANLRPATVGTDGTETITKAYACGLATPVRVSYQASGTDEYTGTTDAPVDSFLRYYLDDGVSANGQKSGADIYVTNIPFSKYDVIVYLATDADGEKFNPVEINGTPYKGDEAGSEEATSSTDVWGTVRQTAPALGANALRVSGLEGNLRIHGGTKQTVNNQVARGGIAAFQIVLADDGEILETVDPDRGVLSLNFNSNRNNNSSDNSVPNTNAFYGLDAVPGWAWYDSSAKYNDQGSSAIDNKESVNVAYDPELKTAPQVTISAANGYGYSSSDPFMRAYLDDNSPGVNLSAEVPYEYYDVIVYSATDNTGSRFQAVGVNGTDYRWRDDQGKPVVAGVGELFGWGGRDAAFGQNAQRINGQTANPLTIVPRARSGSYRSGIAAIQIIERPVQEITVNTETTAQKVFAKALPGRATKLAFAEGGALTGAVNLSGVAVDLTQVAASPFSGALTVDANTKLYLPAGTRAYTLTTGTVAGILAAANVFIGGTAIPADAMTQNGANLTFDVEVSYNWTGVGGDKLWSNPANWSGNAVPKADSEVTVTLEADDAKTITLDKAATVASLTITGPASDSAKLTIATAEGVEGAKLTVVDKMFTTGNVAVTQKANIAVAGTSQMGDNSPIPANQVVQAGFQVNGSGATYTVASGALEVGWQGTDGVGDVSVSNEATLEVGKAGSLYAAQAIASYFDNATSAASGTLSIAGTATFSKAMGLRTDKFTVKLVGGTMTAPRVNTFHGLTVSAPSVLKAPDGRKMTVSGTTKALTGAGDLTLQGTVDLSATITTAYTGELTAAAGSAVTLGENRPKLSVVKGATVNITPTAEEQASGRIAFGTSMADAETVTGVTFTVAGVTEEITPSVADDVLTLKWKSAMPTLATSGDWSASNWTVGEATGQTAPASGTVVLDGTAEGGITVTLDTVIPEEITSIILRGNVTLVTSKAQGTIPASVTFGENVVLTVGAVQFASGWTLPSGATLKVTDTKTSLFGVTLNGVVELAFSGTTETPATYSAPVSFFGGLTVSGSDVSITDVQLLGDAETCLTGDNVSLTFSGASFYTRTTLINEGAGNQLLNIQNLNGEILANAGTLTLEVALVLNEETSTEENPVYVQNVAPVFKGLTIAEGATVTFTGVGTGGQFAVTGAGTLDMGTFRKQLAGRDGTLVKNLRVTATDDEQKAGEIRFLVQGSPALPDGFQVVVTPAEGAAAWEPTWDLNGQNLVITNTATVVSTISGTGRKLWSATTSWDGGALPTEGEVVIEGGTSGNGLIVYLDTAIPEGITSITVRGKVSLQTSADQPTLPLDILHVEEGTTLGLEFFGNNVTQNIASLNVNGGLLLSGDNVTLTAGTISGTLAISPATHNGKSDTVRISGDNSTLNLTSVAEQTGVAVTGPGNTLNIGTFSRGSILTLAPNTEGKSTSLTLNSCANLGGVDIQSGTTLKLAASWDGGELHAKGAGTLDMSAITETAKRPTLGRYDGTSVNLPSNLIVTATAEEIAAGKIVFTLDVDANIGDVLPTATVIAEPEWTSTEWELAQKQTLTLVNTTSPAVAPVLPEGSELSEEALAALNAAAEQAGITGSYTVSITTGGATVPVDDAEAAALLQEILDCFTGLTFEQAPAAQAEGETAPTLAVAYEFGIAGVRRTADGWAVTAKVQGENAAQAGFAAGNAYTLTVNGTEVPAEASGDEASGTVTLTLPEASVTGDTLTFGVKVSRPVQKP